MHMPIAMYTVPTQNKMMTHSHHIKQIETLCMLIQ
uniref:Uncharacterized protein n=1 Tax=Arundo donax TaxID=35708 RepID=A0A0A8Y765_ARUDO